MGREHTIYQSDNGSEYVNKEFKTWVGEDRFRHGLPYSPTTQGQAPPLLFGAFILYQALKTSSRWSAGIRNRAKCSVRLAPGIPGLNELTQPPGRTIEPHTVPLGLRRALCCTPSCVRSSMRFPRSIAMSWPKSYASIKIGSRCACSFKAQLWYPSSLPLLLELHFDLSML